MRHGHLPEREIQTGIGPVAVRCPRVRDRGAGETGPRIRFTSRILLPYLRRAKSIEELLPWLYLKGISTGDFCEALAALLGPEAPGLSASTIARLKEVWQGELEHWQLRDLSAKRYVYFWADGVYFSPRLDHDKQCMCVIIGADELGRKELLAIADGYRESAQSWREVLLDLKRRGLAIAPELATGDGALGFWKALREVYGTTREQRCWVHKTANVLNKLPKSVQPRAKQHLQDIWMAETRAVAEKAFDFFLEAYGPKYDKAVACLAKDRDVLLAFYDFPAEHWKHIRTTNPIESTFASVRLRERAPQDHQDQGLPQPHDGAHHGLQAVPVGQQEVAPPGRLAPHRRHHSRRQIQGRRKANRTRRLKPASPTFDNSSSWRTARRCSAALPLIPRSMSNSTSIRFTACEGTLMPQNIAGAVRREARVLNSATVSVTLRARPSEMAENSAPTSLPTSGLASIPILLIPESHPAMRRR